MTRKDVLEKVFRKHVKKTSTCWKWVSTKSRGGYGKLKKNDVTWLAHRFVWTIINGPIPHKYVVCHRCDNPSCVRPSHLFLGTHSDNTRDAVKKGRHGQMVTKNTRTHCRSGKHQWVMGQSECRECYNEKARNRYALGMYPRKRVKTPQGWKWLRKDGSLGGKTTRG